MAIGVNSSECKWMQINAIECKRMQVDTSEFKWTQINSSVYMDVDLCECILIKMNPSILNSIECMAAKVN